MLDTQWQHPVPRDASNQSERRRMAVNHFDDLAMGGVSYRACCMVRGGPLVLHF